jgi:hypothetical protein
MQITQYKYGVACKVPASADDSHRYPDSSLSHKTTRLIAMIEPAMMSWLRERSTRAGCSVAELVRRSIAVSMTEETQVEQ